MKKAALHIRTAALILNKTSLVFGYLFAIVDMAVNFYNAKISLLKTKTNDKDQFIQ
jgi:hypothetical protein